MVRVLNGTNARGSNSSKGIFAGSSKIMENLVELIYVAKSKYVRQASGYQQVEADVLFAFEDGSTA